ncbi:unnamed protein product [Rotaria sp. Silwood2]|nr:unnamed protein product [Rotaria sp. Silwood2]CAF4453668.1 unnamed protein product [Rotaria sp. Silwood2]
MYSIDDGRQMAKLFLYDFVSSMRINDDFVVLAMNDRRLLTLMIADPNDPNIRKKIRALPSRNQRREVQSPTIRLVQHIEKCADMNLNNDATIENNSDNQTDDDHVAMSAGNTRRYSVFCYVENLYERFHPNILDDALNVDSESVAQALNNQEFTDQEPFDHDSHLITVEQEQQTDYDLDAIRQKMFKYEQDQLKSVQMANAGKEN